MKLWIENEAGEMIECKTISRIEAVNGILIFESEKMLMGDTIKQLEDALSRKIGCRCVIVPSGIRLAAGVSPGELCEK